MYNGSKQYILYFLPHSHSWLCRYYFHPSWASGRADGQAAAATLSELDLCNHKLEEVQTWHRYSYHDLGVQRHGQTRIQPVTLTL